MSETLEIILTFYIFITCFVSLIGFMYWMIYDCECNILGESPLGIYRKNHEVNWFGATLLFLVYFVTFLAFYIMWLTIYIIVYMYKAVRWLCTVGRKK